MPARTYIRTLEVHGRYALVEAEPRTGRLHQIRRHLKHISCPVIGDVNYGKGLHNRWFREQHGLGRLFLHALRLRLPLPLPLPDPQSRPEAVPTAPTAPRLTTFEAPLPPELVETMRRLREDATGPAEPRRLRSSGTDATPPPS